MEIRKGEEQEMKKRCEDCGEEFETDDDEILICPDCAQDRRELHLLNGK